MKRALILTFGVLAAAIVSSERLAAQQTVDHAARFNGTTDFIAGPERITAVNDFTMEAWVRPTATHQIDRESQAGYAGIDGQRYAIYPGHGSNLFGTGHAVAGISVGTNGVSVYEHSGDHIPAVIVYETQISGWTHVAVVYRDRTPTLYVNGSPVRVGQPSVMEFIHPSIGDNHRRRVMIGGIGGGEYGYFAGEIDDVRIWDRPLSPQDVTRATAGIAGLGTPLVCFDMNRAGAGAGLKLANIADEMTPALAGAASSTIAVRLPRPNALTYGTAVTPVFVPRSKGTADRGSDIDGPRVSNPLNPVCRPDQIPVGAAPELQ